jgi:hypothetical protein
MNSRPPRMRKPEAIVPERLDETAILRIDAVLRPAGICLVHQPSDELRMQCGELHSRVSVVAMWHSRIMPELRIQFRQAEQRP